MPFYLKPQEICAQCPYGVCVIYVGDQQFKDRATHYRITQSVGMSCAFDSWIPGFTELEDSSQSWSYFGSRVASNAEQAGGYFESIGTFEGAKYRFSLTSGQKAKVAGDVFEVLVRAIMWNCCVEISAASFSPKNEIRTVAAVTLGDNYDLHRLFRPEIADQLSAYEKSLQSHNTRLCYSTPDLIVVDITDIPLEHRKLFNQRVENLSLNNQRLLSRAHTLLEGHIHPENLLFAAGIKTSIRSDRMYQLLFEANAWKFIWREIFGLKPSKYYTIIGSLPYGTNIEKLGSVDFTSAQDDSQATRAIDDLVVTVSPAHLKNWFFQEVLVDEI